MVQHHLEPQSQIRESTWQNHPSLPRSVEHSLLRRLRTLSSLEQDTLRKAAVVGDRFWKGCVEAMERLEIRDGSWGLQDGVIISHVDDRGGCLQSLEKMGLVERLANSSVAGEQEYRFQHRLLRNLCREQLPASVRQKMHQSVSQWLLVRDRERVLVPELARHLRLAGLPREAGSPPQTSSRGCDLACSEPATPRIQSFSHPRRVSLNDRILGAGLVHEPGLSEVLQLRSRHPICELGEGLCLLEALPSLLCLAGDA